MDQQLLSNPCSVLVVLEANAGLATMLESSGSVEGTGSPGLAGRPRFEYIVLRGLEESSILIAARADNCNSLECLHFESYEDRRYKHQGKERIARSRLMVCKVDFKQNIGHLGNEIVIAGVHGSRRTMNLQWQEAHKAFFDRLHAQILSKKIQFLCGDFNMSLTDVPKQLARRGLKCDCVAWYPWKPRGAFPEVVDPANTPSLGLDSCAIFYIGGTVEVQLHCDLSCAVKCAKCAAISAALLDEYTDQTTPGKFWTEYKSTSNGSHAPLCVYTNNASARSMDAELRRAAKKRQGRKGKYAAVAGGESRQAAQSGNGKCSQEDTASVSSQRQDLTFSRRSSEQYRSSGEHASYEHVLVNVWDNEQLGDTGRCQYTDRSQGYPSMYPCYLPPGLTLSRQGQSEQHWHPEHEKTLHLVEAPQWLEVPTWLEAYTPQSRSELELELARQSGETRLTWQI